jgi:hypothetical protein
MLKTVGVLLILVVGIGFAAYATRLSSQRSPAQVGAPAPARLEYVLFAGTGVGVAGVLLAFLRRREVMSTAEIAVYVLMVFVGVASAVARRLIFGRWR